MTRFICRASSVSKIMTEPRLKKDKEAGLLSETAKEVVVKSALKEVFGYSPQIKSKYIDKGLELEDDAIKAVSLIRFVQLSKNTERLTNEWVTGECDILASDHIRDTKCSWSLDTFPWTDDDIEKAVKKAGYHWQGQVYMWLWDKPKHYVDYVLLPTPQHLLGFNDDPYDHIDLVESIPLPKRIKSYCVERDDKKIEAIKEVVERCQDFYNEILKDLKS